MTWSNTIPVLPFEFKLHASRIKINRTHDSEYVFVFRDCFDSLRCPKYVPQLSNCRNMSLRQTCKTIWSSSAQARPITFVSKFS